jgi:uncharacterized protein YkwD
LSAEALEDRLTPAGLSAEEQLFLELVNRARANPVAEATRLGINLNEGLPAGTISSNSSQPLAPNTALQNAIEGHLNYLGTTATFSHIGAGDSLPWDRTAAAGYASNFVAENLAYSTGGLTNSAITSLYNALFIDSGVDDRGHRVTMLNNTYREVGTGVTTGLVQTSQGPRTGLLMGQDFGLANTRPFLTGVLYTDAIVDDNFYTIGEGIAGATITAVSRGGLTYTTTTGDGGGYVLELPPAQYTVTMRLPNGTSTNPASITIGSINVKLDYAGGATTTPPVTPPNTPPVTPPPPPPPPAIITGSVPAGVPVVAVGSDANGAGVARLVNPTTGQTYLNVTDIGFGAVGGIRVAVGDLTGDGIPDLLMGTGPGRATQVKVISGSNGAIAFDFAPFESAFTGGVFVTTGDLNNDGKSDLIVTPDEGGGPRVRIFAGGSFTQFNDFFGIDDPDFRGGARAAVGDVDADGRADLVVSAGFGGGPRLAVFDGEVVASGFSNVKLFGDFFVFEQTVRNGAYVSVADVDGDGFGDIISGAGPGGGPRVRALSGKLLMQGIQREVANYFAGDPNSRGGVRVAARDLTNDGRAEIISGAGPGSGIVTVANIFAGTNPASLSWNDIFNGIFVG